METPVVMQDLKKERQIVQAGRVEILQRRGEKGKGTLIPRYTTLGLTKTISRKNIKMHKELPLGKK